jgi:DNA mismatch repair protein MutS2
MDERTLRVLEYSKVLEMLAEHCSFSLSKDLARSLWPKMNKQFVQGLLSETTEARDFLRYSGEPPFGAVTDVRGAVARARVGGTLSGAELLAISDTLRSGSRYKRAILDCSGDYRIIKGIASGLVDLSSLRSILDKSIGEDGEVLDSASPSLAAVRKSIAVTSNRIRDRMESIVRDPDMVGRLQEAIITVRNDRFVVPVKQEHRGSVKGIVHDQSSSGATLFIEPLQVVDLNNHLVELRSRELEEIDAILRTLSNQVASVADEIISNVDTLARLDLIFAKGKLSLRLNASEPEVSDRGIVDLRRARHPLLKGDVVPVSPRIGDEYSTLVITGPNTGGKTVTLKVIGLLCLMAQSGLHIPADAGSVVSVFEGIYADIGDEQSIEQSLSTFSSHLTQIVNIVERVNDRSLVLLDELGAGTDPTEGAVLAIAILNYLHGRGARTVATTHYGQLKVFTHETPGFENASMEFDLNTLRPTYRLNIGLPGSSNALAIAERLGLRQEIVEDARGRLGQHDVGIERLIEAVHSKNLELDQKLEAISAQEQATKLERAELQRSRLAFEREKEELLRRAREEAGKVVGRAKREAEEILKNLRELLEEGSRGGVTKDVVAAVAGETRSELNALTVDLDELGGELIQAQLDDIEPGIEVRVGQSVYLPEYKQEGTVVESRTDSQVIVVQVGVMKVAVDRSRVKSVGKGTAGAQKQRQAVPTQSGATNEGALSRSVAMNVRSEIDLRGMTVDDALLEVDRYLDSAALAGLPSVRIIHGKGTGALRRAIREMLDSHHHVATYRDGEAGEGGSGVTVASITK